MILAVDVCSISEVHLIIIGYKPRGTAGICQGDPWGETMTRIAFMTALLACVCALALPVLAFVQTAPDAASTASEVVVTRWRGITNGNNSPALLTAAGAQPRSQLRPFSTTDALEDLPDFQGARGQAGRLAPNNPGNPT
ncbi:MAG TPA: hypothetical protein VMU59_06335 [Caulobacteraceae bacterium]|nr:hypothetical protein [Caulobacteraceae bacterium]